MDKEQHSNKLTLSSTNTFLTNKVVNNSLSLYGDQQLQKGAVTKCFADFKKAFPKVEDVLYDILVERAKANGFTNERFINAMQNMIDTTSFPSVDKIIQFDRRIEMLTEGELMEKAKTFGSTIRNYYTHVDIDGILYYAKNEDVAKYNLPKWKPIARRAKVIELPEPEITEEERLANVALFGALIQSLDNKPELKEMKKFTKEEMQARNEKFEEILRREQSHR